MIEIVPYPKFAIFTLYQINTKNKIANSSRVVAGAMCLYIADGKNCTCTIMY